MLKKILLALIFVITAITSVTYAEDDMKTAASKAYVDTKIETKQLKIPAAGQPNVGAGETVMTYTSAGNGQIGERALYSDISSYDATTDGDKLITASALNATFTNLPTTPTTKLECANESDGCTLWTIVDQTAYARGLPDGYTRLAYIQSTGTQYIDTGIIAKSSIKAEFMVDRPTPPANGTPTWQPLSSKSDSTNGQFNIFESTNSVGQKYIALLYGKATTSDIITASWVSSAFNQSKFVLDGGLLNVDNNSHVITSSQAGQTFNSGNNLRLFMREGSSRSASCTMYYMKLWDGNTLVRNFIPAKQGNIVGMYDTVSGRFFMNAATSGDDFTPGPTVN